MSKHLRTAILSFVLAVLMAMSPVSQALAENAQVYISELLMSSSKEELEAKGFTVFDEDLNSGTGEGYIYIGYKTTTDPNEAITDISVMDMKGGYSFGDYNEMIKQQKVALTERAREYKIALKELCAKYKAGSPAAQKAVASLNMFKEDDSGKLVGDLFLDPKISDDDLIKIFMQGSMIVNSMLDMMVAVGLADYKEDDWLKRFSKNPTTDEYYGEIADDFLVAYEDIRTMLKKYVENDVSLIDNPAASEEYLKALNDDDKQAYLTRSMIYEGLKEYAYGDGTLADFFMQDDINAEALYPLIDALTEGQRMIARQIGLTMLIMSVHNSETTWAKADKALNDARENAENDEPISVYISVDRSFFDGGVALTDDAKRKSASTGDNSALMGNMSAAIEGVLIVLAQVAFSGVIVSSICTLAYGFTVPLTITAYAESIMLGKYTSVSSILLVRGATVKEALATGIIEGGGLTIAGIALLVSLAVLALVVSFYIGFEVYNYYHPSYTEIPLILMDLKFGENDDVGDWEKYVRYDVVRNDKGGSGDLNDFEGKQWNALYTTKDKSAGKPIIADSLKIQYGDSAIPRGYDAVHYFGSLDAFDLNTHCYDNDVNGIFMFFKRNSSAYDMNAASVFSAGAFAAVAGLGGLIVGALGMALLVKAKKKTVVA